MVESVLIRKTVRTVYQRTAYRCCKRGQLGVVVARILHEAGLAGILHDLVYLATATKFISVVGSYVEVPNSY